MPAAHSFDYAVVRVVPRVDREEFVNAGVIVFCLTCNYLAARIALDRARVLALHPGADLGIIEEHLASVPRVAAGGDGTGPIGRLDLRERFHWLVAPRSTMIQPSQVHVGRGEDPARALEDLLDEFVRLPQAAGADA